LVAETLPWRYWPHNCSGKRMSFGIYLTGFLILIIGLAVGANMMHVPPKWIGVGVICLVGLGILLGVTSTKTRDRS
jgi:protein-S-isoprenylcysteine O-methyltransferase Ste14